MENVETFVDELLFDYYQRIHQYETNNWDIYRFGIDGIDRSKDFNIPKHINYFKFFIGNADRIFASYLLLSDNESKKWLKYIILFRLLSHLHVRLPTNTPAFWNSCEYVKKMSIGPSEFDFSGVMGPLSKFKINIEDHEIALDCWWQSVAWTFLFKQYHFVRNKVHIRPEKGDYVIDAGACFGDTSLAFAACAGELGKVFSFDIVPNHIEVMRFNFSQNPELAKRIEILCCGLGNEHRIAEAVGQVKDSIVKPGASLSSDPNGTVTSVTTIDKFTSDNKIEKIDFVKMDIEGEELNTLKGAVDTLRLHKPKLAISLYHKPEDIIEIPKFINDLGLGYKLYLDHYTIHAEETILYATAR
jgi:FkbM family methyltransferase